MLNNLGLAEFEKLNYHQAEEHYNQAIELVKSMGIKLYFCDLFIGKTEALIARGELDQARDSINEAISQAKESGDQEALTKATLLFHKISGNSAAVAALLETADLSIELKGFINYELWLATRKTEYRLQASDFYAELYKSVPRYEYKRRIVTDGE